MKRAISSAGLSGIDTSNGGDSFLTPPNQCFFCPRHLQFAWDLGNKISLQLAITITEIAAPFTTYLNIVVIVKIQKRGTHLKFVSSAKVLHHLQKLFLLWPIPFETLESFLFIFFCAHNKRLAANPKAKAIPPMLIFPPCFCCVLSL